MTRPQLGAVIIVGAVAVGYLIGRRTCKCGGQ